MTESKLRSSTPGSKAGAGSASLLLSLFAMLLAAASFFGWTDAISPRSAGEQGDNQQDAASAGPISVGSTVGDLKPSSLPKRTSAKLSSATVRFIASPPPATKDELEAEAEAVVAMLLDAMPAEARALHVSAILNAQLHRTERAEELWSKCIELAPESEPYYVNLAAIRLDRGDSEGALESLEQAVTRGLASPDVNHHLAVSLTNLGRAAEAIEVSKQALELLPNSAAHWLVLGQAQLKNGDVIDAEQSLRRAIELGAHGKSVYFSLFNACMRNGKREDAKKYREIYSSFDTEETVSTQDRYQVLSESEALRVATSVFTETALLYRESGRARDAEHLWLRVAALDPSNLSVLSELASLYDSQQRVADERVTRERIVELDSRNLLNYLKLAKCQSACDDPEAAEASIKLAISLAPMTVTGYAAMTDFLNEQQKHEQALWYIEHAVALKPTKQGYALLASTLRQLGREADAQAAEQILAGKGGGKP